MRKQPQLTCMICDTVESLAWLVHAAQAMVRPGKGPATRAEIRAERRRVEREILEHRPIADAKERRRWLNFVLESHPELRAPQGRPSVPISGLMLYVLCTLAKRVLDHDAVDLKASRARPAHSHGRPLVSEILRLCEEAERARVRMRTDLAQQGRSRENLDVRVVAQLLGLEEKLVRIRLRPAALKAEIAAARARGRVSWVSPQQLLWAATYRQDDAMLAELGAPKRSTQILTRRA